MPTGITDGWTARGGYPHGIPAGLLTLQARILAVADVFEALTASDRAYRKPNTLSEALSVMAQMTRGGHIDPQLFTLFAQSRAYRDYTAGNLLPEQCDVVDAERVLAILA